MAIRRTTRRLTDRDRKIMKHIGEFRAADLDVIHQRFFADRNVEAARSTMRRLTQGPHHVARTTALDGRRHWYQLTADGARLAGVSKDVCRSLGHQSKARIYALQWYLFLERSCQRRLIRLHDFPDLFPVSGHRLPQGRFCISTESDEAVVDKPEEQYAAAGSTASSDPTTPVVVAKNRLGYVAVDCGAKPQRVGQRVCQTVRRFLIHGWFDELIRIGQFELTLLTITSARRRAYQHSLPTTMLRNLSLELSRLMRPGTAELPFRIATYCVPRLIDIIPGRKGTS